MTVQNPIIAGIDLGPGTGSVIAYSAYFAGKARAGVKLLYVIDYLLTPPAYLAAYLEEEKKREESEMAIWKERLEKEGIAVEYGVMLGRLHESFAKVIQEGSPRLLVIGYKSHLIRPSTSERLIKTLNVPMLVVRGKTAGAASIGSVAIRKILCPVDFSDNSKKALLAAREYASLFSAELSVTHVIPSHLLRERWSALKKAGEEDRERFEEALRKEAESKLSSFCRDCGIDKGGGTYLGDPAGMIGSIADDGGYDLVVMGARGLSYLQGIFIGSTTDTILRSSPCPVLIVH